MLKWCIAWFHDELFSACTKLVLFYILRFLDAMNVTDGPDGDAYCYNCYKQRSVTNSHIVSITHRFCLTSCFCCSTILIVWGSFKLWTWTQSYLPFMNKPSCECELGINFIYLAAFRQCMGYFYSYKCYIFLVDFWMLWTVQSGPVRPTLS